MYQYYLIYLNQLKPYSTLSINTTIFTTHSLLLEPVMQDRWLSVDEIAEYLGVSKDTVYAWVSGKGMPGYKVGRFWKFKKEDVDAWVRAGGAASISDDDLEEAPRDA